MRMLQRLRDDCDGAAMVEFALLAPIMLVMLFGVLMMGVQMQTYNALRGIAYDVNRYTVVEYQKANDLNASQISQVAASIARSSP